MASSKWLRFRLNRAGHFCGGAALRDKKDLRKVFVELQRERMKDVAPLYPGLRASIEHLVSTYDEQELVIVADFLEKAATVLASEARKLSKKAKLH